MKAYCLINVRLGTADEVKESLLRIPQVVEVSIVFGGFDMVAIVESDELTEMKDTLTWKIRKLTNVRTALTLLETNQS